MKRRFRMFNSDAVTPTQVEWLWRNYIPRGKLTLMTGDPQAGKTTLLCDIMAALSVGRPLPGETEPRAPENSWLLSSEDDASDTLVWRLNNQGAHRPRIFLTDEKTTLNTPALQEMEQNIRDNKIALVILDTLTTWMGGDIDMNKANESMHFMNGLKEIAQRTRAAIVLVRHRRKGTPGDNKLHAGMGSIGFSAAVRAELAVNNKGGGLRAVTAIKGNIGPEPPAQSYYIDKHPDPTNQHGVLRWAGELEGQLIGNTKPASVTPKLLTTCIEWLKLELSAGPQDGERMLANALRMKFSESTLTRARRGLVTTERQPDGTWLWSLTPSPSDVESAQ